MKIQIETYFSVIPICLTVIIYVHQSKPSFSWKKINCKPLFKYYKRVASDCVSALQDSKGIVRSLALAYFFCHSVVRESASEPTALWRRKIEFSERSRGCEVPFFSPHSFFSKSIHDKFGPGGAIALWKSRSDYAKAIYYWCTSHRKMSGRWLYSPNGFFIQLRFSARRRLHVLLRPFIHWFFRYRTWTKCQFIIYCVLSRSLCIEAKFFTRILARWRP